MIIMASPFGNHSNRLFQNLHFEAFCKEYGIEYINPSFLDMHKYYISPCKLTKGIKGKFCKESNLIIKILRKTKVIRFIKSIKIFNSENDNISTLLPTHPSKYDIYVGGWYFRVHELTSKYQEYFIEKYTLKNEYTMNNDLLNFINNRKENNIVVVGIHIRRGDYKDWEGGKYYFDDIVYKKYMDTLSDDIKQKHNKNCCFIIFSNENISIIENEEIHKSSNEWYIDHFLMSKCDFLMGPPSTFTMWASYIGKVKYFHIKDNSGNIALKNFTLCKG